MASHTLPERMEPGWEHHFDVRKVGFEIIGEFEAYSMDKGRNILLFPIVPASRGDFRRVGVLDVAVDYVDLTGSPVL